MEEKIIKLLIINNLVITVLVILRFEVGCWIMMLFGLPVLLPIVLLHLVSTNRALKIYNQMLDSDKIVLLISFILFVIFILFQYDANDVEDYLIIEQLIRRYILDYTFNMKSSFNYLVPISLISGLFSVIFDIYIIVRLKRIRKTDIAL